MMSAGPRKLSAIINNVMQPAVRGFGQVEAQILLNWSRIAGKEIASYAKIQKINFTAGKKNNGTIYLLVNSEKALEIQYISDKLLEKISMFLGYKAINRIIINQLVRQDEDNDESNIYHADAKKLVASGDDKHIITNGQKMLDMVEDKSLRDSLGRLLKALSA